MSTTAASQHERDRAERAGSTRVDRQPTTVDEWIRVGTGYQVQREGLSGRSDSGPARPTDQTGNADLAFVRPSQASSTRRDRRPGLLLVVVDAVVGLALLGLFDAIEWAIDFATAAAKDRCGAVQVDGVRWSFRCPWCLTVTPEGCLLAECCYQAACRDRDRRFGEIV